jgi:hypothetical protein
MNVKLSYTAATVENLQVVARFLFYQQRQQQQQ